ncbi:coniferyl aldehyde dehydrogenase [Endozoicomonas ascidiicola]|uniref:coniferyl aldehyde dehydrogenase n=1 Tax=Endozoicomonas ascidiicola TaxID=1698521 RepID=UPI000A925FCB|nr:coniferyl aldehyde dehydrogenase [Endozoicomonas ascidiicola]
MQATQTESAAVIKSEKRADLGSIEQKLMHLLNKQRLAHSGIPYPDLDTRIDRLNRCIDLLVTYQNEICAAVEADFGCRSDNVTRVSELFTSIQSLKFVRKKLKKWMRVEQRSAPFPMNVTGARSEIHYQPKGVVGIMTPWNVPVNAIFAQLADVLGAGNRAMIKPSEFTPCTSELLEKLISEYFFDDEIAVINGDADTGAAFSRLPFDHLIFTGAGSVGSKVMAAAAPNLTPVTLELGGKSPVIIAEDYDLDDAADKLMATKAMNSGQICVSPDYCFVPEAALDAFVEKCRSVIAELYPMVQDNPDFVSVINERHFERILSYLDDARIKGAQVISLDTVQADWSDRANHKIPLHLVINPTNDMLVMQEEIFGPILSIRTYQSFDMCLLDINSRPNPLALYLFSKDKKVQKKVIDNTMAGAMTINDIAVHYACDDLPFGGVGASGMGQIHGIEGFKTFSHSKSVFKQGWINLPKLSGMLPPYGEKFEKMSRGLVKK